MKLKNTTHGVLSTFAAGTLTAASITITPPLADAQETSSTPTASNGNPILAYKYKNSFEHREHFVNDQGRIQYGEGEDAVVCQPKVAEQFLPPEKIGTPGPHEMQLWNLREGYGQQYSSLLFERFIPLARFEVRKKGESSWVALDRVPTREDLEKYGIGYSSLIEEFSKVIGKNSRELNLDQSYDIPREWWFSDQFLNRIDEAGYEIRPIESSSEGRLNPVVLYLKNKVDCGKGDTDVDLPGAWPEEGWYFEASAIISLDDLCTEISPSVFDTLPGRKKVEYYAMQHLDDKKRWAIVEDNHYDLYHGGEKNNQAYILIMSVRSEGNSEYRGISTVNSQVLSSYGLTYADLERSYSNDRSGWGAGLDSEAIDKVRSRGFEVDTSRIYPAEEKHAIFDGTSVSIIDSEGNIGESRECVVKESEDPTTETSTKTSPSDTLTSTTAVPSTVTTTLPPSTVVTTVTPDPVTVTETPKTETTTATSEVTTTVTSTPPTKTTTLPPVTETVVTTETPEPQTSTITYTEKVPTTVIETPEKETVTTFVTPPTVTAPPVTKTEVTTSMEKVPTTVTKTPEKETVTTSVTPPMVTKNIPTTVVTQETVTETKEIPTTVVSTEPGTITTEATTVTETPAPVTSTVVAETPTVTQPAPSTVVENGTAVVHLPEETVTVTPEPETPQQTPVQRVLASTGASVLGLLGIGAGIAAVGAFMIRRKN